MDEQEVAQLINGAEGEEAGFDRIGPRGLEWENGVVGGAEEREAELKGVYAAQRAAKAHAAGEPTGTRASTIPIDDPFWDEFPKFTGDFVAGRMFDDPAEWQAVFEENGVYLPKKLKRWSTDGYSTYVDKSKLQGSPKEHRLSEEDFKWAEIHLQSQLVPMLAVEEVDEEALPPGAVVCNVVVAIREAKRRFCWAGNPINCALDDTHFKMEGWREITELIEPDDFTFSLDLEKGYSQVPLKRSMRNFFLFRFNKKMFRYLVMPFGLGDAPRDFSYIVKRVVAIFRARGIRVVFYIDDLIFFAKSMREALRVRKFVMHTLHRLGIRVSKEKSLLQPGQLLRHLGLDVCTKDASLWVPRDKVEELRTLAAAMLKHCRQPQDARKVAVIVGKLQSWRYACPAAAPFTRGLSRTLEQLPLVEHSGRRRKGGKRRQGRKAFYARDYSGTVELDQLAIAELRMWADVAADVRCTRLKRALEAIAFVDASQRGYGVVWTEVRNKLQERSTLRSRDLVVSEMRMGRWIRYVSERSTEFELANIADEIEMQAEQLAGKHVLVVTDNVGAAHIAGKGCQGNRRLHAASLRLWAQCIKHDVALSTQWLSGQGIIKSGADGLSRGEDVYDCVLSQAAFRRMWDKWGPFEVDCCASPGAIQRDPDTGECLEFVSPYGDGASWADALTFRHSGCLYAFPPLPLIGGLLEHVRQERLKMVVVVPEWPTRPWWSRVAVERDFERLGPVSQTVHEGAAGYAHPFGATFEETEAKRTELRAVAFNF